MSLQKIAHIWSLADHMGRAQHEVHANHEHRHGPGCGHRAMQHGDHIDYEHDGHWHHYHIDHWDECEGEPFI